MDNDDDKVGFGKPPKHTQFQPGRSGNPSGKSKGHRSIANELRDILSEEITVGDSGSIKRITKQRALASALVTAAIGGDFRATAIVMTHLSRIEIKDHAEEEIDFSALEAHRRNKNSKP
jgi:hypothetical protein